MSRIAIVQSNYIPWKGYFDLINLADRFVLLDEVQYTRRDWRNRNRIKTAQGVRWLTIPVQVKGRYHQRIDETLIAEPGWAAQHWQTIRHAYARAAHFERYEEWLAGLYARAAELDRLSEVNRLFVEAVCDQLGIETPISWSTEHAVEAGDPSGRLLALCQALGADRYLSGPAARDYLDLTGFESAGVEVEWMDYTGYPSYEQPRPPFEHAVSVLDLLLCAGPQAPGLMKSFAGLPATTSATAG